MNLLEQRRAAKRKIKKARTLSRSKGKRRAKPGTTGTGEFFHIQVRPRSEFVTFRTQDVGKKGGIERVAGKRSSGSWDDQKWLISKKDAHIKNSHLVPDTEHARKLLQTFGTKPRHIEADRFQARPRPNVPEREKPTPEQRRARKTNIRKAQAARHH